MGKVIPREEGWTQAPTASVATPKKRGPGRPPETDEKKKLRKEKSKDAMEGGGEVPELPPTRRYTKRKSRETGVGENEEGSETRAESAFSILVNALGDKFPQDGELREAITKAEGVMRKGADEERDRAEEVSAARAEGGRKGGEHGAKGSACGKERGKKDEGNKEHGDEALSGTAIGQKGQREMSQLFPGRKQEATVASRIKYIDFVEQKLAEAGHEEGVLISEIPFTFWTALRKDYFPQATQNRDLISHWKDRTKTREKWEAIRGHAGVQGGIRKSGQDVPLNSIKTKQTIRVSDKFRKSTLSPLYPNIKDWFEKQRTAGNYVDREDLFLQYKYEARTKVEAVTAQQATGQMPTNQDLKLVYGIKQKEAAMARRYEDNKYKLQVMLMREIGSRLLKPQRLIHLSSEEECRRAHLSWRMHDYVLYLVCFAPLEELGEYVISPEEVRANAENTAVIHSDQIPFLAKVRPGKQLYAHFEVQGKAWKDERASNKFAATYNILASTTQCSAQELPGDDKQEIGSDGMAHLRGEATENNDKYRITVDVEQVFYNVCKVSEPVVADWGTVSVTFVGAHMDFSNVSADRKWIKDQAFDYNGKQVFYKAGTSVRANHGKAILDLRDKNPAFWAHLEELGFQIYLQPAGFEDGALTKWKVEKQGQRFKSSIAVRDLFGGGLAETTKHTQMVVGQLPSNIAGKMGCALQITDTDVAMRLKNRSSKALADLRVELIKLASAEGTRAIFRCGTYEVLRCLAEAVDKLRTTMREEDTLRKAGRRNGWLAMRPDMSTGKFKRCCDEEWAQDMPLGSHRMKRSWLDERFSWLDENGMPTKIPEDEYEAAMGEEQTYVVSEHDRRVLSTWQELLATGDLAQENLDEMMSEPWFALEVQEFEHFDGADEYKKLIRTPKELRKEAGVDENLTTQRKKSYAVKQAFRHKKWRAAMKPIRKEFLLKYRTMKAEGVSKASILKQIIPRMGSKASKLELSSGSGAKNQTKDRFKTLIGKMAMNEIKKRKGCDKEKEKPEETKTVLML